MRLATISHGYRAEILAQGPKTHCNNVTTDVTNIDVIHLQQQHHLSPCIYEQWNILRQEEEQHAGGTNEYGMVRWSHTSQGTGNGRLREEEDDETSDRTQLVVARLPVANPSEAT